MILLVKVVLSQSDKTIENDSIDVLDEVIVTATRTKRQLSSLPLPAQIISNKEIKAINSVRLTDVLNEQTGLITVPDFGGGEGIQLQGVDAQYTLILVDGVPLVGRLAGTLDINRLTVGNIRKIEIVKGASSSLYGSEALGGVINIITEKPKDGIKGNLSYSYRTFATNDLSTTISYKKSDAYISAFFNRFSSNGYDLNPVDETQTVTPYENFTFDIKAKIDVHEKTSISFYGRYFNQDQDNIGSNTFQGKSTINEWNLQLKGEHEFNSKWKSTLELYGTNYNAREYLDDLTTETRFSSSDYDQILLRPELRTTYKLNNKHSFITGIGMNHESLDRTYFDVRPIFNAPYIYAQYDGDLSDKFNIIIGSRFDAHNEYASQLSPKAAIRYEFNDKISVKGSAGYGYKAPDFRQLYFDFTNATVGYTVLGYNMVPTLLPQLDAAGEISNILVPLSEFEGDLKAESSIAYNLGSTWNIHEKLQFSANLFRNDFNNLIDTRVIANKVNGQNVFSYYNVNKSFTQGIETNTTYQPSKRIKLSLGYQLLYAKDKDALSAFKNGEIFARLSTTSPSFVLSEDDYFGLFNRSRHMLNFKCFYKITSWKADFNIRGTYRSKYGLFDTNGNSYLDNYDEFVNAYSIWDVAFNKEVFKKYTIGVGIDNVFGFTDTQNISNIPGRLIYGKMYIQI
jgi:outer membrane receptor for ferrienterochelin and colicins